MPRIAERWTRRTIAGCVVILSFSTITPFSGWHRLTTTQCLGQPESESTTDQKSRLREAEASLDAGHRVYTAGNYEVALARYRNALQIYQATAGTDRDQAGCHANIGMALLHLYRFEEAISEHQAALKLFQRVGTERDQAACYGNIAVALDESSRHEEAIGNYRRALNLLKGIADTERRQAEFYMYIAMALQSIGQYEDAILDITGDSFRLKASLKKNKQQAGGGQP